ncbi:MAG TPA: toll/interleukin-1 receptor domain-containing protein [Acidimicrobiales bacterium]|nr:toll/interleukin-1 receptor domain-containing protein [Acidimicrobiales bacterium]
MSAGGIFVSYRRGDAAYIAGRLRDDLADRLGTGVPVFRDIEAMPLGPFPDSLAQAVSACAVMLVVIGDSWLSAAGADGRPRLGDPDDWVRREVAEGLAQGKVVVPVLVEGAALPSPAELPDDLAALSRQQAVTLPDARWTEELDRLVRQLRSVLGLEPGVRLYTGPWQGPDGPVRVTVERFEARRTSLRFQLTVDNATADELILESGAVDVYDDTEHQYPPVAVPPDEWDPIVAPGGSVTGWIGVGEGLIPEATVLHVGRVRALGTFEVGSIYATVALPAPPP